MTKSKSQTRQKLIESAQKLIHGSSYGSISVDDICKSAGVNKGSFYHFFKSKSDLVIAALDAYHGQMISEFNEIFSPLTPPLTRLDQLVNIIIEEQRLYLQETGKVCGCNFSTLGSETACTDAAINQKVQEIMADTAVFYRASIQDLITAGFLPADTDVDSVANDLSTFIMGQLTNARLKNSLLDMETSMRSGLYRILGLPLPQNSLDTNTTVTAA